MEELNRHLPLSDEYRISENTIHSYKGGLKKQTGAYTQTSAHSYDAKCIFFVFSLLNPCSSILFLRTAILLSNCSVKD